MPKSHGERRKTRYKLKKSVRTRGTAPVSHAIRRFESGQKVHIDLDPSVHRGMPNPKFHGRTGTVVEQRGSAYLIEVSDGNALKTVIARPQHIRAQKQDRMIVKAVLEETNLTIPEAKEILSGLTNPLSEEETGYEFRRALDHVNTFAKLTAPQSRELVNELQKLEKMKQEIAIRIADIIPLSKDEVRSIYAKERFSLTEAEIEEILDIIARFY